MPTQYAHHELILKAYVDEIMLYTKAGEHIANHNRIWLKYRVSYDPKHYLRLLSFKPGALDYAQPFREIQLPECFNILRKKLEAQLPDKHQGTKEYIKVLQLLEKYPTERISKAIEKALRLLKPGIDIVKQYCIDIESPSALTFDLVGHKHLSSVEVYQPELNSYDKLINEEAI